MAAYGAYSPNNILGFKANAAYHAGGGENVPALKNPRWETYTQARAAGLSQRQAYIKAYPNSVKWKPESIDNKAYQLDKRDEVETRYQELKNAAADAAVLTRAEKRKLLAQMARDDSLSPLERQKAIDIDNKMEDEYIQRVSAEVNNEVNINIELVDE